MSQAQKILNLLSDHEPHSTVEILNKCYDLGDKGIARVGARVWDLKKRGHTIIGERDVDKRSIYWYTLRNETEDMEPSNRRHEVPRTDEKIIPKMRAVWTDGDATNFSFLGAGDKRDEVVSRQLRLSLLPLPLRESKGMGIPEARGISRVQNKTTRRGEI
jgi:hypothetical protein